MNAQFCPPKEQLAFEIKSPGEANFVDIYAEPLPEVIAALSKYDSIYDLIRNLPDLQP